MALEKTLIQRELETHQDAIKGMLQQGLVASDIIETLKLRCKVSTLLTYITKEGLRGNMQPPNHAFSWSLDSRKQTIMELARESLSAAEIKSLLGLSCAVRTINMRLKQWAETAQRELIDTGNMMAMDLPNEQSNSSILYDDEDVDDDPLSLDDDVMPPPQLLSPANNAALTPPLAIGTVIGPFDYQTLYDQCVYDLPYPFHPEDFPFPILTDQDEFLPLDLPAIYRAQRLQLPDDHPMAIDAFPEVREAIPPIPEAVPMMVPQALPLVPGEYTLGSNALPLTPDAYAYLPAPPETFPAASPPTAAENFHFVPDAFAMISDAFPMIPDAYPIVPEEFESLDPDNFPW